MQSVSPFLFSLNDKQNFPGKITEDCINHLAMVTETPVQVMWQNMEQNTRLTAKVNMRKDASSEGSCSAWPEVMASQRVVAQAFSKSCLLRFRNSSMVFVLMRVPAAWYDHLDDAFLLQTQTMLTTRPPPAPHTHRATAPANSYSFSNNQCLQITHCCSLISITKK